MRRTAISPGMVVLVVAVATMLFSACQPEPGASVDAATAYEMVQNGEALLLDVRSAEEYEEAHIAEAISLPFYDISEGEMARIAARGRVIIAYCACPHEETSIAAAGEFIQAGYENVRVLKGGIQDWAAEGYPLRPGLRP